jgi:phospholipase/carboxylesterase
MAISKFVSKGLEQPNLAKLVVVLLHGYGAAERDLPELMNYLPDLPWLSPRAPLASQYEGFSWYDAAELVNPAVEEVQSSTDLLWEWIDGCVSAEAKIIVIGFSQGALMATQLLRTRPDRVQATVILSGFVASGVLPEDAELARNKPKVIYARGLEDEMIPKTAISQLNTWLQVNTKAVTKTYPALGHSVDSRVMNDVAQYLQGQLS